MKSLEEIFGPNTALVEELYTQYKDSPESVPDHWKSYFNELESASEDGNLDFETAVIEPPKTNGHTETLTPEAPAPPRKPRPAPPKKEKKPEPDAEYERIKGVATKVVENMEESLELPTATSLRTIPVKMLIEDRLLINEYLEKRGDPKITFTHLISWAIIQGLREFPNINNHFEVKDNNPYKVKPKHINFGVAIDVPQKNGERRLLVPNIKKVDTMNFREFITAFSELINKARNGNLEVDDFQNTTISITNPGTIGTVSSNPRLMENQGAIIATGAMNYPASFQAMSQAVLNHLGISKEMTITCTYDHRIIQGAESGSFLAKVNRLLCGEEEFYDGIFSDLNIPYDPIPYGTDNYSGSLIDGVSSSLEVKKKAIAVMQLINMYRTRGHVLADLNPLEHGPGQSPELEFSYHGLTIWDLDREFYCGGLGGYQNAPLREILSLLRSTYCDHIGAEYMHLLDLEERDWLRETMESTTNNPNLTIEEKRRILHKLNQAGAFEQFLQRKYIGQKRFSLEGAETLIPMLDFLLENAGEFDVGNVTMGMAHRGRLNVLVNTIGKTYRKVFAEFEGNIDPTTFQGSGDVKYHLGTSGEHTTSRNKKIRIDLLSNPSHLEAVNPVAEGAARAKQDHLPDGWDKARKKVVPVLIHGDAAFSGQGVVAETLNMSQLRGFGTGGTIHIIINNQIGFTTLPEDGRSTQYTSDLAKMILAPIFHVNGDDPEAAVHAMRLALEYREKFGKDVVIDLVCYRKYGHNEGDEPAFTQPGLYKEIKDHPTVRDIYLKELIRKKDLSEEEAQQIFKEFDELLEQAFEEAKNAPDLKITEEHLDRKSTPQSERSNPPDTNYPIEDLQDIGKAILTVPKDFDANPKLLRILAKRHDVIMNNEKKIEWGFAEALAFGSLLKSGYNVRLSGQDVERGTFSQRHSVLHGTETSQKFVPLNHLNGEQGTYYVYNSLLSEFAVIGFEYGYSSAALNDLVIWEAQFGDFSNGGQVITDNFISSGEAKWGQKNNLVMLLPHGYEGQGPEHSSGRLERFLQLCAEDNMQVANCSTPSQYFHILRRQALQEKKKPLILITPKSLLRHPLAVNSVEELANGTFQELIPDEEINDPKSIRRLVLCSGKVYYDLYKYRQDEDIKDVSIARIEQFYPFPDRDVKELLSQFKNVKEIVWCQEEPRNQGAWHFLRHLLEKELQSNQQLIYVGRPASAATATGSSKIHAAEQQELVKKAFK